MRNITCIITICALVAPLCHAADLPTENPAARYKLAWTDGAKWNQVVSIEDFKGKDWIEKIDKAQDALAKKGGGVVYFPAGKYKISDTIKLKSNIIIRGATPERVKDARRDDYAPPTKFIFPTYKPSFGGEGTPIDTAFKGVELADMNKDTHCGIVNIDLDHGHIHFGVSVYDNKQFVENFATYGRNHIIYGCRVSSAAVTDPSIPKDFQHKWQRWTFRHRGAIDIRAAANVLIANNRIPESRKDNFTMKTYKVYAGTGRKTTKEIEVEFKYDNRPGIYMNYGNVKGTPETDPTCFVKGLDIRENYVHCDGCLAIGFSGDGTYCGFNVVRYGKDVYLPIYNGYNESHYVNNVRAVEMRGWRWTVEGTDYKVYRNIFDKKTGNSYNDGEGLMHEQHSNVDIRDSKLINNKGNSYLCLWRAPMNGLLIKGNEIDTPNTMWGAICVNGRTHKSKQLLTVKNVHIVDNVTKRAGIMMMGKDGENNIIKGNRHEGENGFIRNLIEPKAEVSDNKGYDK